MSEDLKPHSDTLLPPLREVDISRRILTVRGHRVIIDADLAEIYGVPTKALNQAVKRNSNRFPGVSPFGLRRKKKLNWSQFVTSKEAEASAIGKNESGPGRL